MEKCCKNCEHCEINHAGRTNVYYECKEDNVIVEPTDRACELYEERKDDKTS